LLPFFDQWASIRADDGGGGSDGGLDGDDGVVDVFVEAALCALAETMMWWSVLCVTRTRVPYIASTTLVHSYTVNSNATPFTPSHLSQTTVIKLA
jgi:hypothetical protein